MKKLAIVISLTLVCGFGVLLAFAGPIAGSANSAQPVILVPPKVDMMAPAGYTIPATNSTMIAPPRDMIQAPAWTLGASYRNGDVVMYQTRFYWDCALVYTGCVATVAPASISGDSTDGGITWRRVYMTPRQGIDVTSQTADNVWISVDNPAQTNKGVLLTTAGSWFGMTGNQLQNAVYAICTNAVHLNVLER